MEYFILSYVKWSNIDKNLLSKNSFNLFDVYNQNSDIHMHERDMEQNCADVGTNVSNSENGRMRLKYKYKGREKIIEKWENKQIDSEQRPYYNTGWFT